MKKPIINKMTTSKLQETAQNAAHSIRDLCKLVREEIASKTVEIAPEHRKFGGPRTRAPETITFATTDIEYRVLNLLQHARQLDWYSVPTEMRSKLPDPKNYSGG